MECTSSDILELRAGVESKQASSPHGNSLEGIIMLCSTLCMGTLMGRGHMQ
jgi:hypothetical protein